MNIECAKEQIRKTCIAYLTKDEFGDYVVPVEAQRPILVMGAPGLGKTAIVAQVAAELGLAFVDYSMTHHTRQSAIGLPVIERKTYGGQSLAVSEYTTSEIIANIYDEIERTGCREGIVFLDEINCVSETLTPMMLRFLQEKKFGNCSVPKGWVVVCAGNPPEYNRSARTFDMATLDRVKRIDVEPDYQAWRNWAQANATHQAVLSFLDMRPDSFFHVETRGHDRNFVTARAWSDLSTIIRLYEHNGLDIDEELVSQYVQVGSIARDFAVYLRLFASYAADYRIGDILKGSCDEGLLAHAHCADFDERAALSGLLVEAVAAHAETPMADRRALELVRDALIRIESNEKAETESASEPIAQDDVSRLMEQEAAALEDELRRNALHYQSNHAARYARHKAIEFLRESAAEAAHGKGNALARAVENYNMRLAQHLECAKEAAREADNALQFVAQAFGEGNELVLFLREMTMNPTLARLVGNYDVPSYFEHQGILMLETRAKELQKRLEAL